MNGLVIGADYGVDLRPGDRFEIDLCGDRLFGPPQLLGLIAQAGTVEASSGASLPVDSDSTAMQLRVDGLSRHLPATFGSAWIEYRDTGHFRISVAPAPSGEQTALPSSNESTPWQLSINDQLAIAGRPAGTLGAFALAQRALQLAAHGGFDQLRCLPLLRDMEILEHQTRTAKTVLQRFRGRALLCDEVGLGKTIEAGLILRELHLRGLVRSVLILTPPSLVAQWQAELQRKFSLDVTPYDASAFRAAGADGWRTFDRIIASMHTAKRQPHRSAILDRTWDLVIVDEAHHMRNRSTLLWKLVNELKKQYILLLTATPVQNNLEELFNLVTVLEPGLLSTSKQFQRRFINRRDKMTPKNIGELHGLLSEVMVRNRRSTVGLRFTRRWARTERVELSCEERSLYEEVAELVRAGLRPAASPSADAGKPTPAGGSFRFHRMTLLALQTAMGSSPQAAAGTLARMAEQSRVPSDVRERVRHLSNACRELHQHGKTRRLLELLDEFPDKMVVFTQFLATQKMLEEAIFDAGHDVVVFHGGLSRMEKEAAIDQFRSSARILLCTESGSEGRNLQFAHAICNYDLPWNPMKIEQRIGRLSRIGQQHDVHVFNLVAAGTVEDAVLHLLDAKLAMFELVVGEIDMVLGNLDEDREFHEIVADEWGASDHLDDFRRRMDRLGERLLQAKEAYLRQRDHDDRLFGDRFTPE